MRFLLFGLFASPFLHLFWGTSTVPDKNKPVEPPAAACPVSEKAPVRGP